MARGASLCSRLIAFLAVVLAFFSTLASALSASDTVLVLARDAASAVSVSLPLQAYGIPYQVVTVPSTGATLPALNSSTTAGNYGAIVVLSEVSYQYSTGFYSALTAAQWQQLYDYQTAFGVRMVRLDVYPEPSFGTFMVVPSISHRLTHKQARRPLSRALAAVTAASSSWSASPTPQVSRQPASRLARARPPEASTTTLQ